LILVVLGLLELIGHTNAASTPPINTPPPEYRFFEIGVSAAEVSLILLAVAGCSQFAFRSAARASPIA
jgi:hypothetical protein